jgi:hypothetical protein
MTTSTERPDESAYRELERLGFSVDGWISGTRIKTASIVSAVLSTNESPAPQARVREFAWDDNRNRNFEPVETLAQKFYAKFPYDGAGGKPTWVKYGNSLKQDEARSAAREELRLHGCMCRGCGEPIGIDEQTDNACCDRCQWTEAAPHPPVEGLREWFNSFRGDHGKTEWDQLLSILVSPSLTAGPVGYISPETLAELTNNANGVGPVVASAAYSTVIPLYAAPATLTEQPSEAPPSAPDVREALEPFVAALDGCVDESARDDDHIWESPAAMNITVGNLRVLRAIYETLQPSEYREDRAIARVMASKTAALSQQPVAVADRGAIIRECASIAVDHTPKKFEGTLAAHATGRAIECAILAILSAQPAKGER